MDEDSRIYGSVGLNGYQLAGYSWITFGSNVFDFDGSIAEAFKDAGGRKSRYRYLKAHRSP